MKKYESIFILNDRKFDDGGQAYSAKIEEVLKSLGAENIKSESLGRKQFARPIGKKTSGLYWDFIFEANPESVEEFLDKFRLEDCVIRQVVYNYDVPAEPVTLQLDHK